MLSQGFVFGKFYPFHLGHSAMINFALKQCQSLDVLVCCSNAEVIPSAIRADWIRAEFANEPRINVIEFNYDESVLPNTSVSNEDVSQVWASEFKQLLPTVELLVTSEPYGNYVAKFMAITHIAFDAERSGVPISASAIRTDMFAQWYYLPASVQRYFQKKLVVSGTESTGKTHLCKYLAANFPAASVSEVGRDLIASSKRFERDDLYRVAEEHAKNIFAGMQSLAPLVVIDTDIYVTQAYARFMFDQYLDLDKAIYDANNADMRIFLDKQAPYVQDGTRLDKGDRDRLERFHMQALNDFNQPYTLISGADWDDRIAKAMSIVSRGINVF